MALFIFVVVGLHPSLLLTRGTGVALSQSYLLKLPLPLPLLLLFSGSPSLLWESSSLAVEISKITFYLNRY